MPTASPGDDPVNSADQPMTLRGIVQDTDTRAGRAFDLVVLCLILVSVASLSVETLPGLPPPVKSAFRISEIVITILFTVEYFLRIATSERKAEYIFSFYGIIDLVAILPFYLALGIDLRVIRAVRLFRVFLIFKLARYNRAMERFGKALLRTRDEATVFLIATCILLYISAVGIYYCEHEAQPDTFKSVFHSLWWAVATLTAVGYGDVYPITVGGKIFTFVMLMCGLGVVAVPAGLIAAALTKVLDKEEE